MRMVRTLVHSQRLPVIAKIRLLQTPAETVEFSLALQEAGAACIVLHARKRGSTKHRRIGAADLQQVALLRQALRIPVISNGNVREFADISANRQSTQAHGIMSAEALLANPRLFASTHCNDIQPSCIELAEEYVTYTHTYEYDAFGFVTHSDSRVRIFNFLCSQQVSRHVCSHRLAAASMASRPCAQYSSFNNHSLALS
jgi:tRNA-dihydrouridine synthase